MVKKKGRSRSDIEAFKKEILFLSKLTNHPNIIKMYDFCDSPGGISYISYIFIGDISWKRWYYVNINRIIYGIGVL